MGLSSSQARLLNLTSRMHQIEYKAARLEAEKLQMANESDRVYNEYLDALDKTKIQHKILTTDGSITYVDLSSYSEFLGSNFALVHNDVTYAGLKKSGSDLYSEVKLTAPTDSTELAAVKTATGLTTLTAGATYYERIKTSDGVKSWSLSALTTNATDAEIWAQLKADLGIMQENNFETCGACLRK